MRINKVALTGIFSVLVSFGIYAENNSDLASNLAVCLKIPANEQRLACFDNLARGSVDTLAIASATNAAVKATAPVKSKEAQQIDNFSNQHLKKAPEDSGPNSITSTITKTKQLLRGQWVIYLENGQKWQQKDSTKMKLKVGDSVRLKKGSMGAVYLFKEGSHRNIRVKRLK